MLTAAIENKYFRNLGRLFNQPLITAISKNELPAATKYILNKSQFYKLVRQNAVVGELFDGLYAWLFINYQCEYIYKTLIANQIFESRHSPHSTILTEFKVANCQADVVILNGTSTAYEIKTELDSFDRLGRQLAAYRKAFDYIYVVIHHSLFSKLPNYIDDNVGIICLNAAGTLETVKTAASNKDKVDSATIFDCLRKSEYLKIIADEKGYVPNAPNTMIYKECRSIAETIPGVKMHERMVEILRNRLPTEKFRVAAASVPQSLRLLYLEHQFSNKEHQAFLSALNSPVRI